MTRAKTPDRQVKLESSFMRCTPGVLTLPIVNSLHFHVNHFGFRVYQQQDHSFDRSQVCSACSAPFSVSIAPSVGEVLGFTNSPAEKLPSRSQGALLGSKLERNHKSKRQGHRASQQPRSFLRSWQDVPRGQSVSTALELANHYHDYSPVRVRHMTPPCDYNSSRLCHAPPVLSRDSALDTAPMPNSRMPKRMLRSE